MITTTNEFRELLRDCHIRATFKDVRGHQRHASMDAQLALLRSLGVDLQDPADAPELVRESRHMRCRRGLEPVQIAWDGNGRAADVTLPSKSVPKSIASRLDVGGQLFEKAFRTDELPIAKWSDAETDSFLRCQIPLPGKIPHGYHRLHVAAGPHTFESLVISAPRTAYIDEEQSRSWGCFLPLYALRTEQDWGVGDFTSLGDFTSWIGSLGGSVCGTLPLLAAFLDEPFEISPYRPVSRLFWNELYIDIAAIPELRQAIDVQRSIEANEYCRRIANQRNLNLVDYREVMKLKRAALEGLAREFFTNRPPRFGEFQDYLNEHPETVQYARFRATCERQQATWPNWPARMAGTNLADFDYVPAAAHYHAYVQWIAHEQLAALHKTAAATNTGLYLDLPVGVDPAGYDTWQYQSEFIAGVAVGSPPDIVFPKGQDWGLPPMHPERMRESGYDLFRRVMANNMKFARRLRIDHILAFHRLYCIPPGFDASDGAYVEYPAEELYAIAVLESHRHQCELIGENLGTVTEQVNRQLKSHGIAGMWVAPYELEPGRRSGLRPPPADDVAMLNTHDMPPLAAWWIGADIDQRAELQLIGADGAEAEREHRFNAIHQLRDWLHSIGNGLANGPGARQDSIPLRALLRAVAASKSRFVLINLEDLWLERCPQNVPGVRDARPNWQRKARYRFEEFRRLPEVTNLLKDVNAIRNETSKEQVA
jgi:4-alpha-glucanotransferase